MKNLRKVYTAVTFTDFNQKKSEVGISGVTTGGGRCICPGLISL